MKCLMCADKADYICICGFIPLCGKHITPHQKTPGSHTLEYLNITLSGSKYYDLPIKSMNLLQQMEASKKKIRAVTQTLIKKVLSVSNSAINYIDLYSRICILLMNLERVSSSLKSQADIIITQKFKVKEVNIELDSYLEYQYYNELVTCEDNHFYQRSNSLIQFEEEKKKAEDRKSNADEENLKRSKTVAEKDSCQNPFIIEDILEQKKKLMSSYDIKNYECTFGRGKYFEQKIQEIKFSSDNKFAFVCEVYLGIFK